MPRDRPRSRISVEAFFCFCRGPGDFNRSFLSWHQLVERSNIWFLIKASVIGLVIALPWYIFNYRHAWNYARFSSKYVRHSLGPIGIERLISWIEMFANHGLGYSLMLLMLLVLAIFLVKIIAPKPLTISNNSKAALWTCLLSVILLLAAHLTGDNHNIRLISPCFVPLAVGLGILTINLKLTKSQLFTIAAISLVTFQLSTILISFYQNKPYKPHHKYAGFSPSTAMARFEQYDWQQLRKICKQYNVNEPTIVIVGNSLIYNLPQISFAWVRNNENIKMLRPWHYGKGVIDWNHVNQAIDESNVVLTAPGYEGFRRGTIDNQHNREVAELMRKDPRFFHAATLSVGRFEPYDVLVFIRK